jgi:hypothetical protein
LIFNDQNNWQNILFIYENKLGKHEIIKNKFKKTHAALYLCYGKCSNDGIFLCLCAHINIFFLSSELQRIKNLISFLYKIEKYDVFFSVSAKELKSRQAVVIESSWNSFFFIMEFHGKKLVYCYT